MENQSSKEKQLKEEYNRIVKPVRTYERDIAESLREKKTSQTDVYLEERKSGKAEKSKKLEGERSVRKFAVVLILIVSISAGTFIFLQFSSLQKDRAKSTPKMPSFETLIRGDSSKIIDTTGKDRLLLVDFISGHLENISQPGRLVTFNLTKKSISGEDQLILASEFLNIMSPNIPDPLLRSFEGKMTFGYFILEENRSPFLLIKIESFDNAFFEMFRLEEKIPQEFSFLSSKNPEGVRNQFEDMVSRNKDLRVLKTLDGRTFILYSFLDPETLLITDELETFIEVLDRFLLLRLGG